VKISKLYGTLKKQSVFIVGTGPSLRLFPVGFFTDKITIGLNQAWRTVKGLDYLITIHPDLLPNKGEEKTKIITKIKNNLQDEESYYFFQNNKDVKNFEYCFTKDDTLYVGRGIHTAAMVLAAKMGVKWVFLCGCDLCPLGGDHHATNQTVQFHGLSFESVYKEYYLNARLVRKNLAKQYKIDFLSVNPFISNYIEEDYNYLIKEQRLKKLNNVKDVSEYSRNHVDFE